MRTEASRVADRCCPPAALKFATGELVLAAVLALWAGIATGQDWNCADPGNLPQQGMNYCAHQDYLVADAELNEVYGQVRAYLSAAETRPDGKTEAEVLRDAQRAWIPFRDLACDLEGGLFRGGSMEPFIVSSCLTRLTRDRTRDLRFLLN